MTANKLTLETILKQDVVIVVAKLSAKDIIKLIKKGKAVIKTAGDRIIIAAMKGKDIFYFEEKVVSLMQPQQL